MGIWSYIKQAYFISRKRFCEFKKPFLKITHQKYIPLWKEQMLQLTKEELKPYEEAKECYICGKEILEKFAKDKIYQKVRDHCHYTSKYRGAVHSTCNFNFSVPN